MANTNVRFFNRLPPELRNEIYRLVLTSDEDTSNENFSDQDYAKENTVDIIEPFPTIIGTCKQMRAESMPIYLNNGYFYSYVHDRKKPRTLIAWLRIFKGLDDSIKRALHGLRIFCAESLIPVQSYQVCRHQPQRYEHHVPDFETWNNLLACVTSAGITAQQITIEPTFTNRHLRLMSGPKFRTSANLGIQAFRFGRAPYLFSRFIVPSLLHIHGLYDDNAPPYDAIDDLRKDPRLQTLANNDKLKKMVISAARMSKTPPEFWFEGWAAKSTATATMQASIKDECARLVQERLHAQQDGLASGHLGFEEYHTWLEASVNGQPPCAQCASEQPVER